MTHIILSSAFDGYKNVSGLGFQLEKTEITEATDAKLFSTDFTCIVLYL